MPSTNPLLSIIIVTYNSAGHIENCIRSIMKNIDIDDYETIVVDNCSSDDTVNIVKKYSDVIVIINSKNYGFATANNKGFKIARGEYVVVLNPDVNFTKETNVIKMIEYFKETHDAGIIAPKLYYRNGDVQENARSFPNIWVLLIRGLKLENRFSRYKFYKNKVSNNNSEIVKSVDWVIGAFFLIQRKLLVELNYFDPKYFMYYEDADLCLRAAKKGYRVIYYPFVSAIHDYMRESSKKYFSKLKFIHIQSVIRFYSKKIGLIKI
jgi:GT2 family glycosyltransferase